MDWFGRWIANWVYLRRFAVSGIVVLMVRINSAWAQSNFDADCKINF
jgi:hypothetical protein